MAARWTDPKPLRRIVFETPEEWKRALPALDALLAFAWSFQHDVLGRLPATRERSIAEQKLEELVCYTRLAIIDQANPADEAAGAGDGKGDTQG